MSTLPTDPDQTADVSDDLLPGYDIISVIGSGGFGTVFKARQLKLNRVVAVKVIQIDRMANPDRAARFESEAMTLAKFHHPNIVQVYDYGYHNRRMFIAMELLEGEDLGQRLQREGKLDERTAWALARQTAASLAHAASHGVVHRDIKPANLYLIPSPTGLGLPRDLPMVKVTDFGLAMTKWTTDETDRPLSTPGSVLGTPLYMAPEQFRGSHKLDHRADIYSLGATLFHVLAGHPPYAGATVWDIMAEKLKGQPPHWPDASPPTVALVKAMMAPDWQDRPATYDELIERIDEIAGSHEAVASWTAIPRKKRWRNLAVSRRAWLGAAATALVAAGLGWYASRPVVRRSYLPVGDSMSLFEKERFAKWLPTGGSSRLATDSQKSDVLAWSGFIRRDFPLADNFRVALDLNLFEAQAIEVHFALPVNFTASTPRLVLRLTKADGAVLGLRGGEKGEFHPKSRSVPYPAAGAMAESAGDVQLVFERAGRDWAASFQNEIVGRLPDAGQSKAPELVLFAEDGTAHLVGATWQQLEPVGEK